MKASRFSSVLMFATIICFNSESQIVQSKQVTNSNMEQLRQASSYLYGTMGHEYNPQKAFLLYSDLAAKGHAQSNNVVGVMYANGIGILSNAETALKYYEKAGNLGYAPGLINAARMYSEGKGIKQNFARAFQLYKTAAEKNDREGKYYYAYYMYKGLGGEQDYYKAYKIFSQLAEQNHASAMYFKALCLRNGYGVERDLGTANKWLLRAIDKGDKQAKEELESKSPENPTNLLKLPFNSKGWNYFTHASTTFARIHHNVSKDDLNGTFVGYAIRYDWSGEFIIEYWPITLKLENNNESLVGKYLDEDGEVIVNATLRKEDLQFENTSFFKDDHYTPLKAKKEFKDAYLQVANTGDTTYLFGKINMFVPFRNEPDKPMIFYLSTASKSNHAFTNILKINIFPNPSDEIIVVDFLLPVTSSVKLIITDMIGKVVYVENGGILLPGTYQKKVSISTLAKGAYNLNVVTEYNNKAIRFIRQ